MASSPLTTREYAYVRIHGPGKHETITEILGMDPSEAWNAGDANLQTGRPRKAMSWLLYSGIDDTHAIDQHIKGLLRFLLPKAEALRQLWVDYDLTLVCVGYYPPNSGHGLHVDREQIRQAAQLGLAFDLDFYYLDDYGHDV